MSPFDEWGQDQEKKKTDSEYRLSGDIIPHKKNHNSSTSMDEIFSMDEDEDQVPNSDNNVTADDNVATLNTQKSIEELFISHNYLGEWMHSNEVLQTEAKRNLLRAIKNTYRSQREVPVGLRLHYNVEGKTEEVNIDTRFLMR